MIILEIGNRSGLHLYSMFVILFQTALKVTINLSFTFISSITYTNCVQTTRLQFVHTEEKETRCRIYSSTLSNTRACAENCLIKSTMVCVCETASGALLPLPLLHSPTPVATRAGQLVADFVGTAYFNSDHSPAHSCPPMRAEVNREEQEKGLS